MISRDVGDEAGSTFVLVDAHVHIHQVFLCERFLDAAARNFSRAADELGAKGDVVGYLMLTESAAVDCFADLADGRLQTGYWQIIPTEEGESLAATRPGALPLFLIAGRQIATAERLELLALGTRERFPDGAPLRDALAAVADSGAVPVVPWGFGKWTGGRGRLIAGLLTDSRKVRLYAGDNGGRPRGSRRPRLLAVAERHGKLVLPGTDPLPFPGEANKVGRYGFVAEFDLDHRRPLASLRLWLQRQEGSPRSYGQLEGVWTFAQRQIGIQYRRIRRGTADAILQRVPKN
jgi:hypothetical protein